MAFNHRKLFSDSSSAEISSSACSPFCCDPSKKRDDICPESCITWCRSNGNGRLTPAPLDPLAPTATLSPPPNKPSKLHLFLIISLPILATIFLLFCCCKICKYYKNWRSRRRRRRSSQTQQEQDQTHDDFLDQDHGSELDHPIWYIRTVGLNPSTINSIAVCKYKRGDGLVEGTECSVCLNEFQEDETLRLLPKCNHAFHIICIDNWLRSHTNCPLCRAGIAANPARLPTPSPEQSVDNSIVWEETQMVISEGSGDFRRETEEEGELQVENGKKNPETSKEEVVDEVQRMRRSVSVDSLSASVISAATANAHSGESDGNSGAQLVKVNESNVEIVPKKVDVNLSLMRSVGDSSAGRSLQKGPVLMKRSVSCTGKFLLNPGSPVGKGHT